MDPGAVVNRHPGYEINMLWLNVLHDVPRTGTRARPAARRPGDPALSSPRLRERESPKPGFGKGREGRRTAHFAIDPGQPSPYKWRISSAG
jgi:hypothetical protein